MVIGSLPRPRWIIDLIEQRESGAVGDDEFDRRADSAVAFAVGLQEAAGIDVITDGEWRRFTYFTHFSRAVSGFKKDAVAVPRLRGGTKLWPAVNSRLECRRPIAADEVRFLRKHTDRMIKATLPTPYIIDRWFYDPVISAEAYPTREDLIRDAADILRKEALLHRDLDVDII